MEGVRGIGLLLCQALTLWKRGGLQILARHAVQSRCLVHHGFSHVFLCFEALAAASYMSASSFLNSRLFICSAIGSRGMAV